MYAIPLVYGKQTAEHDQFKLHLCTKQVFACCDDVLQQLLYMWTVGVLTVKTYLVKKIRE